MDLLKLFLNPALLISNHLTFWGGGGSKGGGSQTSTSYSTNLPEYAKPYYQELLKQTGREVFDVDEDGYVTGVKSGESLPQLGVAGFNNLQTQTQNNVAGMTNPTQFGQSSAGLGAGQQLGYGAAAQGLNQAFSYSPDNMRFGQPQANFYSSPYQQNVTDMALREAMQNGTMQKQDSAMGAIGRGTFGGARQALLQAEGDRNLMRTMGDIQARGSQDAFMNAQQQFNADQQRMNQSGQYSANLGSQLGMAGLNAGLDSSKALGALGTEQQNADLARLTAQGAIGAEQQALEQRQLDTGYQNAMAQQNQPRENLQYYSDILRGNAGALGSTQVQYSPQPSQSSQLAGLGLAGLGLAKSLG